MKKPNVMKIFNTVKKAVEKKSPEILIAFGIAGMITTTVLAVKATRLYSSHKTTATK